jgi:hypothetical protein
MREPHYPRDEEMDQQDSDLNEDLIIDNEIDDEEILRSSSLDEIVHSEDERVMLDRNGYPITNKEKSDSRMQYRMPVDTNLHQDPY